MVGRAAGLRENRMPSAGAGPALGIGLQNIPERAAVSLPLAQEGESSAAPCGGAASGVAGWLELGPGPCAGQVKGAALPWLMSLLGVWSV